MVSLYGRGGNFLRRAACGGGGARRIERVSRKLERVNQETEWEVLGEREFSDVMIGMEDVTSEFYEEGGGYSGDYGREEAAAIQEFWQREWGCSYDWRKREWRHTSNGKWFESEGEKRAKLLWIERKEEEEEAAFSAAVDCVAAAAAAEEVAAAAAAAAAEEVAKAQRAEPGFGMDWVNEYDDDAAYGYGNKHKHECDWTETGWVWSDGTYGGQWDEEYDLEAYEREVVYDDANERIVKLVGLNAEAHCQREAPSASVASVASAASAATTVDDDGTLTATSIATMCCQGVLYLEEHTDEAGNPDWRMFIYYDECTRRYVVKGSRRSVKDSNDAKQKQTTKKNSASKSIYPDVRLAFRRSRDVLDYLAWCMNPQPKCDVVMYAMGCDVLRDLSVNELCRMRSYGQKTELYGYDGVSVRSRDLADQLYILRNIDWKYSNFDDVRTL